VKPASPLGIKFYKALCDAISRCGEVTAYSTNRLAVTSAQWTAECIRLGLMDVTKENVQRSLISKYRRELIGADLIAQNGESIYILKGAGNA
jgi:hypothetical protein